MGEEAAKGNMEHGLVFAEVTVGLFLIGVLVRHGLVLRDVLFTAFLFCFIASTFVLWVLAQRYLQEPWYAALYFGFNAVCLMIGFLCLIPSSGLYLLGMLPYFLFGLVLVRGVQPWQRNLEGCYAIFLLMLAGAALLTASHDSKDFERVKLLGLGVFFLAQAVSSGIYVMHGTSTGTKAAAVAGVFVLAWMAIAFSGLAPEGGSRVFTHDSGQEELAVAAAHAERRGL